MTRPADVTAALPASVLQSAAQTMRDAIPVLSRTDPRAARALAVQASLLLSFASCPPTAAPTPEVHA